MKKTFTILMALMVLCFTQCKPTPEGGDDNAQKVRVSCVIPMNDGSKSDFTNLMTNGKINWSNGRECVYLAIHGNNPQIIELVSYADGYPSKLEFSGEAAEGLITSGEEYDIWYFGHSQQLDAPYYNLANDRRQLTGSIANQSGNLSDLGYCHIAKTKVTAVTENGEVKLNLKGTLANQIAIALLDLNNVTELYGDAIIGTEYALECTGGRYELNVVENNNAKINVEGKSGISYVIILPNENNETNIKIKRGGNTYAYTFHNSIKANKVYYRTALDGTPEALTWEEIEEEPETPTINGHEYVDLGLPSGLLWATCNLGANSPEAYGDYYAWGVTETYENGDNYSTYFRPMNDISGNPELDAATANWGNDWRMPTETEQNELLNNCTWTWTTINSIKGYTVTGPNGKYIFLPAAGDIYFDGENYIYTDTDINGYYWSSTPYPPTFGLHTSAYSIDFSESNIRNSAIERPLGQSIRPVSGGNFDGPEEQNPNTNGYGYVDLGLSVNWATCNVGAENPEEYGNYYAWGETTTKDIYDYYNNATYGLSYSELKSQGYIDENGNLTLSHDAARVNWGGDWRMPTSDEFNELSTQCTWNWEKQNNVDGYVVTGPNGNSIFLPAAGERCGEMLQNAKDIGSYWSSKYSSECYDETSFGHNFGYGIQESAEYIRYYGLTIRPVIRK